MVDKVVTSKAALLARVDILVNLVSQLVEALLLTLSKVGNDSVYDGHSLRRPLQATHKEVTSSRVISKEDSRREATNKEATVVAINVSPSVVRSPFLRLVVVTHTAHLPSPQLRESDSLLTYACPFVFRFRFLFFLFFSFYIPFVRPVIFLSSSFPFFSSCKTRSSTHFLTTLPVVSPLHNHLSCSSLALPLKSRLYPQSDLYYYDGFSRSHFSSCPIVAWVGVSPSNLSSPLYFQLKYKRRCFCCCLSRCRRRTRVRVRIFTCVMSAGMCF